MTLDLAWTKRPRSAAWFGLRRVAGLVAAACLGAPAVGQTTYHELEPNDSKLDADGPFVMAAGDMIVGLTTGSSTTTPGDASADYFMVRTAPLPPGIYQHRLVITTTGPAGHTGSVRGLTQSGGVPNPASDSQVQVSSATTSPPRYVQWYGFGREETIYFRVIGTSSTTAAYTATLETVPVAPIEAGTYYQGNITIDRPTGVTTDVDFWVYDSNFNAIPDYGNDTPDSLTRGYGPGTYYIGYTNYNFANEMPAASDEGFLSGAVLDFPGGALNSSTTLVSTLAVQLTDAFSQIATPTPKNSPFEIPWVRFTVTDVPPTVGACCLPAYACEIMTPAGCAAAGGTYLGDDTVCGSCPPPPPGVFLEFEPNDSKEGATFIASMESGNTIVGVTTGTSTTNPGLTSADYFLVKTAPAAPGIYQHRLIVTSDIPGHTLTIRGLNQTSGIIDFASDGTVQTSTTSTSPPRYIQWYGFGREEQVYVRITGTASTTAPYTITLETTPVGTINLGTYYHGDIAIARPAGVSSDTDFWVYDSNFNAIPDYGNDDPNSLIRTYAPGTYYVAYTNYNLANEQPAASDDTFRSGIVMDYPAAANSSTTTVPTLAVQVTDAFDTVVTPTPKFSQFEIVWLQFTVGTEPPLNGACCLPDGTCMQATFNGCISQGGLYSGDNTFCGSVECPQPGACCMANLSCSILSEAQCSAAGGLYMGNGTACGACPTPPPGSVAILAADSAANVNDVIAKLAATDLFPFIGTLDVQNSTPTLQDLQQFDAVMVFSNLSFNDANALGNVLADYVDAGGGVVVTMFTVATTTANRFLGGRWDDTYQIVPQNGGTSTGAGATLGTVYDPGHDIMQGVNTLAGGTSGYRPTTTWMTFHGAKIAEWSDGKTLAAVSITLPNRADIGLFPPSSDLTGANWDVNTDGARLMANALLYVAGGSCIVDWNNDGSVNSTDISAFLSGWLMSLQNGTLEADFNADGAVNSSDISSFLTAWLNAVTNGC